MPYTAATSTCYALTTKRVQGASLPLNILIVDDNPDSLTALEALLGLEGFFCRTADGGEQAIMVATQWHPDIIVMDISMPGLNGIEASLALKEHIETQSIIIIAFTALNMLDVKKQMRDHEFDGYCQKGYATTQLIGLIRYLSSS